MPRLSDCNGERNSSLARMICCPIRATQAAASGSQRRGLSAFHAALSALQCFDTLLYALGTALNPRCTMSALCSLAVKPYCQRHLQAARPGTTRRYLASQPLRRCLARSSASGAADGGAGSGDAGEAFVQRFKSLSSDVLASALPINVNADASSSSGCCGGEQQEVRRGR